MNELEILTSSAEKFLQELQRKFNSRRLELLQLRSERARSLQRGETLDFLSETRAVREGSWQVAAAPADLTDRRVEITGPAEAKMIINALNSGAKVFMADFEDSLSPTWKNLLEGQWALQQAVRRTLQYRGENGKEYQLKDKTATLVVRPRGLHFEEPEFLVDGVAISGSLFDFGLYFFHNAKELLAQGSGPYFYLPKMESHLEARWWNEVFVHAQNLLNIPRGSIRATCLIETIPAAFEMEEFLYELRDHASGLNAGRWDYIFSFIKKHHWNKNLILPDRAEIKMSSGFMTAYCELLVNTCHRRGAHAIGGMSAFIPNRKEPEVTANAIDQVKADKHREMLLGFDGTWVAHPDLVNVALQEFNEPASRCRETPASRVGVSRHRLAGVSLNLPIHVTPQRLLSPHIAHAQITERGVRSNINVALLYIEGWLRGIGAAALHNLMEDAATAEISRSQLWQWLHHSAKLETGEVLTQSFYQKLVSEEESKIRMQAPEYGQYLSEAVQSLNHLVLSPKFEEFLTTMSYRRLRQIHQKENVMHQGLQIEKSWSQGDRWHGIQRNYTGEDVLKLRTSLPVVHSIAEHTCKKLWENLNSEEYVPTFGAMTGAQAVQMVKGGLKSIYLSGWQVAADANLAGQTYPDQSLYPSNSVPQVIRRINNAFQRADQIERTSGKDGVGRGTDWYAPIVADAEAGFGGPLHAFELMKSMIEAGAAGVHFEDQLAAEKKCGHLAGKVLIPTCNFVRTLQSARLAADVLNVETVIIARTDALSANLMTSDIDKADHPFLTKERTPEGYYVIKGGLDYAIARSLAYAPWADVLWFETSKPDMAEAEKFAAAIHAQFPGKILAYNCSPSFNWKMHLSDAEISNFQKRLGQLGYKFQFITLAGWHLINYHTFDLAKQYAKAGMPAYVNLQEAEFAAASSGYTAVRHQQEVGTGYFDQVLQTVSEGKASTGALHGSTEEQFNKRVNESSGH